MQKIKALLIASIIFTGCKVNQHCEAYASQCDELYRDYNCDIQPRILTTPQYPTTSAPVPWYYYNNAYRCDFYGNPLQSNAPNTNRPRPSIYHNHGNNSTGNGVNNSNPNVHRKPIKTMGISHKKRD